MKIFSKGKSAPTFIPPDRKVKYPKWTFAKLVNSNKYYLLLESTKMEFISERAFQSWGKPYILVTEESISDYKTWKKVGFSVGSMVRSMADGTIWFITGKDLLAPERRLVADPDFFNVLGFDLRQIFVVSLPEVDFHTKGDDIIGVSI